MRKGRGRRAARWLVAVCMPVVVAGLVSSARARSEATKRVTYHGYRVEVPTSWPVVDLVRNPPTCVRFDVDALYLGHPGADQFCPAKLLGRTEALLIEPIDRTSKARVRGGHHIRARAGTAAVAAVPARTSHEITAGVSRAGVLVTGSYRDDRGTLEEVVGGATLTSDAQPTTELAPTVSTATSVVAPGTFTGTGGRLYETSLRPGKGWSNWIAHGGATLAGDPTAFRYSAGCPGGSAAGRRSPSPEPGRDAAPARG